NKEGGRPFSTISPATLKPIKRNRKCVSEGGHRPEQAARILFQGLPQLRSESTRFKRGWIAHVGHGGLLPRLMPTPDTKRSWRSVCRALSVSRRGSRRPCSEISPAMQ